MKYDYRKIRTIPVKVKGVPCEFYDMRIERETVPAGKYQYEVAGDDESGADPSRIRIGVLVNFYGTLICDRPLPLKNGVMWLEDGDFEYADNW